MHDAAAAKKYQTKKYGCSEDDDDDISIWTHKTVREQTYISVH